MTRRNRRTRNKSIKRSSRKVIRSIRKDINLDRKGRRSIRKDRRSSRKVRRSTRKDRRSSRKDRRSSRKRRTSKKLRRRVGGSAEKRPPPPLLALEDVKVVRWWEPYLENADKRKKELNKDQDKFKEDLRELFRGLDIFCKKWDLDKDTASPISKNNCIMAKGVVELEDWSPHDEKPWINPKGLLQIIYGKTTPPPVKKILQDVLDLPRKKLAAEKWREWEVGIRGEAERLNEGEGEEWKLASKEALGDEAISLGAHVAEKVLTEDVFVEYVVKITKDQDQGEEQEKGQRESGAAQALLDAPRESGATVEKQGDADETLSVEKNNILTFIEEMFHQNFTFGVVEGAEGVILEAYKNLNNLSNCLVDDCEHRDMVKEFIQNGTIDTKGFLKELNTEVEEGEAASIYSLTKNKSTGVTKSSITGSSPGDDKTQVGRQRIKKNSQMEEMMPELFVTEKGDVPDKPKIKDVIIQKYLYYSVYKKFKDENEGVVTQDPIEIGKRIVERLLSEAKTFEGDLEKDILYKVISMGNCKNIYNNKWSDNPNDDKKITDTQVTQVTRNLLNARFNNKYQLKGDNYVESDQVPIVNLLNDINIKVANLDSNDFGWIKGEFTNEGGEVEGSATLSIVVANADDPTAGVLSGDNEEAKSPRQDVAGAQAQFDEEMEARRQKRESEKTARGSLALVTAEQARDDVILGEAKLARGRTEGENRLEKRLALKNQAAAERFRARKQPLLLADRGRAETQSREPENSAGQEDAAAAETQSRGSEDSGVQTGQEDAAAAEAAAAAKIQAVQRGRRGRLSAAELRKRAEEAAAKDAAAAAAAKKKAAAAVEAAAETEAKKAEAEAVARLKDKFSWTDEVIAAKTTKLSAVDLEAEIARQEHDPSWIPGNQKGKSMAPAPEGQRTREARDKLQRELEREIGIGT